MSEINPEIPNFDTNNTQNDVNQTLFDFFTEQLSDALHIYYMPSLVVLGSIGNLVSVFVFRNSKLRLQSISLYLSALAISDTLFLFQLLFLWLSVLQLNRLFNREGFCQVFSYISYVTCCLSAWLVVAFTVERFVAILYPLQRNAICTKKRARCIIYCLAAFSIILNIPVLRFAIVKKSECTLNNVYLYYAEKFNLVDTFLSFTAPLAIIIILNTSITVAVVRMGRARHQMVKTGRKDSASINAWPRSQPKVTRMLLIVSSVYVILNMPAYTMRVLAYMSQLEERTGDLQKVALMFFYTNFGINFILYCLSGENFRRALAETIPWLWPPASNSIVLRRVPFNTTRASSVTEFRSSVGSNFDCRSGNRFGAGRKRYVSEGGIHNGCRSGQGSWSHDRDVRGVGRVSGGSWKNDGDGSGGQGGGHGRL